jgi:hypothetical protein
MMRIPRCSLTKTLTRLLVTQTLSVCALANANAGDLADPKDSKQVVQPKPTVSEARFYARLGIGGDVDLNATKFLSNGGGTLLGDPVRFDARYFPKIHDETHRAELEAGYWITPAVAIFGRFDYTHAYTSREPIGYVQNLSGQFGAANVLPVSVDLSDYESYAGSIGVKVKLPVKLPVQPYISTSVGAKYVEPTFADFTVGNGVNLTPLGRVNLYDSSWTFTADLRIGFDFEVARNFSLGIEGGLAYDAKLDRSSRGGSILNGTTGINDGGNRLYVPLTAHARFRF